jgi:hypothetical protein
VLSFPPHLPICSANPINRRESSRKPSLLSKAKSSNRTVSPFMRQKCTKISPSAEPGYWSDEIHAFASPAGDTELIFRERMEADIVFTRTEGRTLILI